jgi:hypothetical protein
MLEVLRPRALRLRTRMWWSDPAGHCRDRVLGPSDWDLATADEQEQVRAFADVVPVHTVLRNARQLSFRGFDDRDAFRVVADDDVTRSFLEKQVLQDRMQGGLRDIASWLLSYTLFERRGFAEIAFASKDDRTVFKGLRVHNQRTIERSGAAYVYHPQREVGYVVTNGQPREILPARMIDVARDLPVSSDELVGRVLAACWEDRLTSHASLAGMQAAAQPELSGWRWQAVRLRQRGLPSRTLLSAQITYDLYGSLIEHGIFFSEPVFTPHFLRWQHHVAMSELGARRDALVDLLNHRVIAPLVEMNALAGTARLEAVGVLTQQELDELYEKAQQTDQRPYEFYVMTTPRAPRN